MGLSTLTINCHAKVDNTLSNPPVPTHKRGWLLG